MLSLFGEQKKRVNDNCQSESPSGFLSVLQAVDLLVWNVELSLLAVIEHHHLLVVDFELSLGSVFDGRDCSADVHGFIATETCKCSFNQEQEDYQGRNHTLGHALSFVFLEAANCTLVSDASRREN